MLELFAFLGLFLLSFGAVLGGTAFVGWLAGDSDDYYTRWFASSLVAGLILALFIFLLIV